MQKLKQLKFSTPVLFMVSSLIIAGSTSNTFASNIDNPDSKPVFNSLESLQISCTPNGNDSDREIDRDLTAKIINMAASNQPEQRLSALSHLAGKVSIDAGILQKILQTAIRDSDSNVRAQAVYAIAQQNCTDTPLILEQALQDSELSVRLLAVDSLGSDEQSISLLEYALNDDEEAIRELASTKLEALSNVSNVQ